MNDKVKFVDGQLTHVFVYFHQCGVKLMYLDILANCVFFLSPRTTSDNNTWLQNKTIADVSNSITVPTVSLANLSQTKHM